jgi:hypothetical protein
MGEMGIEGISRLRKRIFTTVSDPEPCEHRTW